MLDFLRCCDERHNTLLCRPSDPRPSCTLCRSHPDTCGSAELPNRDRRFCLLHLCPSCSLSSSDPRSASSRHPARTSADLSSAVVIRCTIHCVESENGGIEPLQVGLKLMPLELQF